MAASTLSIGNWTHELINNVNVWTCKVTTTTADLDLYMKKSPKGLDPTKPWTFVGNTAATSIDGQAVPMDLYIGWSDAFELTENNAPVVTDGVLYKADVMDDLDAVCMAILMHPNLTVAEDVAAGAAKCYAPIAPYYIFNLDGATALEAVTVSFKIMQ
jgi:hypothetical protein